MRRYVLLVVLVVLAGCSGVADDSPDRDPYSVDDVVDPDASNGSTFPPGLGADGLEDDRAVLEAHADELADESYSIHVTATVTGAEGSEVFVIDHWTFHEPDRDGWHVIEDRDGEPVSAVTHTPLGTDAGELRIDHWDLEGERFQRLEAGDRSERLEGVRWEIRPGGQRVESGLAAIGESTVETRTFDGEGYYEVDGETPTPESPYRDDGFDATVYVTSDGLVEYYEIEGTILEDGEELTVHKELTVYDIGETSLEEPAWVGDAREE